MHSQDTPDQTFNPDIHYLGTLCKHRHDWKATGRSVRLSRGRDCVECSRERNRKPCPFCGGRMDYGSKSCWSCLNKKRGIPTVEPNPSGLCMCGCGEKTRLARQTHTELGYIKGKPIRYIRGHQNGVKPNHTYEVQDCGYSSPCWDWRGPVDRDGYGVWGGKRAHRRMYLKHAGDIPEGYDLHHKCENPSCVNPDHLEPITRRLHKSQKHSKLTDDDVRAIRSMRNVISQREIGEMFGISQSYVGHIIRGKNKGWVS